MVVRATVFYVVTFPMVLLACAQTPLEPGNVKPENALAALIQREQRAHVRESWGEWNGQCFTQINLDQFIREERPRKIAHALKRKREFVEIILALKSKNVEERRSLFKSCRKPLRKTWAELGRIDPAGQTTAGQRAELLIANAVVDLAEQLVEKPAAEIGGLWSGSPRR